jgi:hypothetical protein
MTDALKFARQTVSKEGFGSIFRKILPCVRELFEALWFAAPRAAKARSPEQTVGSASTPPGDRFIRGKFGANAYGWLRSLDKESRRSSSKLGRRMGTRCLPVVPWQNQKRSLFRAVICLVAFLAGDMCMGELLSTGGLGHGVGRCSYSGQIRISTEPSIC